MFNLQVSLVISRALSPILSTSNSTHRYTSQLKWAFLSHVGLFHFKRYENFCGLSNTKQYLAYCTLTRTNTLTRHVYRSACVQRIGRCIVEILFYNILCCTMMASIKWDHTGQRDSPFEFAKRRRKGVDHFVFYFF